MKLFNQNLAGRCFFLLAMCTLSFHLKAQTGKTLYVDQFDVILGDQNAENNLLTYASSNGYEFISVYRLHHVLNTALNSIYPWNQANRVNELRDFLIKAHSSTYNMKVLAVDGDNFSEILNYENNHSNANEQFDGYNLEYEFWNGGYQAYNLDQAWQYYIGLLSNIYSHAQSHGKITETYIGNIMLYHPNVKTKGTYFIDDIIGGVSSNSDRILIHIYVDDPSNLNAYNYVQERLFEFEYFAQNNNKIINLYPLFSFKCNNMGNWFKTHSLTDALNVVDNDFSNHAANDYPNYINTTYGNSSVSFNGNTRLLNSAGFAYSFAKYNSSCVASYDDPVNLARDFNNNYCDARMLIDKGKGIINNLNTSGQFTFECNFKLNTAGCYSTTLNPFTVYNNFFSCSDFRIGIEHSINQDYRFFFQKGGINGTYYSSNTVTVSTNSCYSFAVTYSASYNGGTLNFYLDGLNVGTVTNASSLVPNISASNYVAYLGYDEGSQTRSGNYLMDEFKIWNIEKSAIEIIANNRLPLVGNESNLVAYWKFDEVDGQVAMDATFNEFHAQSGTSYSNSSYDALVANSCYQHDYNFAKIFDGSQIISKSGINTSGGINEFTVEFWMQDRDGHQPTLIEYEDANALGFKVSLDGSGYVQFDLGSTNFVSNTAFNLDECHHLAISVDASAGTSAVCSLYVDGLLDAYTTLTYSNSSNLSVMNGGRITFGGDYNAGTQTYSPNFTGDIDEIRIWKYKRSSTQIGDDYATFIIGQGAWLVGYWRLDEQYAQVFEDRSASGNNLFNGTSASAESYDVADIVSCSPVSSQIPDRKGRPASSKPFFGDQAYSAGKNNVAGGITLGANQNRITAYPNPFQDKILLGTDQLSCVKSISLISSIGNNVNINITNVSRGYEIDVPEYLPDGVYFLIITSSNGVVSRVKLTHFVK